jgi:glycolate oxidase
MYKEIDTDDIDYFISLIGIEQVLLGNEDKFEQYTHDHTEDLHFRPSLVLLPTDKFQIAAIMQYCNLHNIIVTPRGAGTGLSGGALAVQGGVVLSTEKLNKILYIDQDNFQVIVQPGVINEALQQELKAFYLFYPPDPASKGSCFLGGNVAHASGGPKAVKYGTTRDYVLNLEVVLPTGDIIKTGANTLKYSTGYNLTHLMIGSEGTLGIVTEIVLKVIPLPRYNLLMLASFSSAEKACEAVNGIFHAGCVPSVCEFVEPDGFRLSSALLNVNFQIPDDVNAYLLIEVDGNDMDLLHKDAETIYDVLEKFESLDVVMAEDEAQKEYLWKLRRTIGEATKRNNIYKEEDTVVPRATLPKLYTGVKEIGKRFGIRTVCYGHAGDGNLHVNILKDNLSEAFWQHEVKKAIIEIFTLCKTLGGTISGEHGIGFVQKEYMPIMMPSIQLELMRNIKRAFDPNMILNPGKIF